MQKTNYSVRTVSEISPFPVTPTTTSFDDHAMDEQSLPPAGQRVIVLCAGYRCLGYRDEHGVWRTDARNEPIENVKGWANFE